MDSKRPSFQFYPKDLLSDGIAMSFSNGLLGAYFILLCFDWLDDGILDSDVALTKLGNLNCESITELPEERIKLLRMKFKKHPIKEGFISNPRLQKERKKQDEWQLKCSRGGKKSASNKASNKASKTQVNGEVNTNTSSTSSSSVKKTFTPEEKNLAQKIRTTLLKDSPKLSAGKNIDSWANDIRLFREVDKLSLSEIWELFEFANSDDFWRSVILSPANLRKNKDRLLAKKNEKNKNSGNPFDDLETQQNNETIERQMEDLKKRQEPQDEPNSSKQTLGPPF